MMFEAEKGNETENLSNTLLYEKKKDMFTDYSE